MTLGVIVDYQVLFNIALGIIAFLGGVVANNISGNLKSLGADLKALDLAHSRTREEYVPKTEHASEMIKFEHRFDRIEDKLDNLRDALSTKT